MKFQYPWQKRVFLMALIFSIAGLLAEFIPFLELHLTTGDKLWVAGIKNFLNTLNLFFFAFRIFFYVNFENGLMSSYLNLIFYLLLFVGAIMYLTSRQKETRLIRFVLSIIFITAVISAVVAIYLIISPGKNYSYGKMPWVYTLVFFIKDLSCAYISYWALKKLSQEKKVETYDRNIGENIIITEHYKATRWQRFFNTLMDIYICAFIFSIYSGLIAGSYLQKIVDVLGDSAGLWVLLVIFRLIYYPFFETILGATPAKFLSETRVLSADGSKVKFTQVLGRTFTRFVPFNSFSFFGYDGWHDRWPSTQVVQEKRTGVYGGMYFIFIPLLMMTLGLGYWGYQEYKDYKSYRTYADAYEKDMVVMEERLNNLTTNDFIQIYPIDESGFYDQIYMKVEKVEPDHIVCTQVYIEKPNSETLFSIEKYYTANKNDFNKFKISKADLSKAYLKEYDDHETNNNQKGKADLLKDGHQYRILAIERLFGPVVKSETRGYRSNKEISLSFYNCGWPANIIKIENIEGNVKWTNNLPMRIETVRSGDYPTFELEGETTEKGMAYRFIFTVEDSLKHQQVYEVEGRDLKRSIKRIR